MASQSCAGAVLVQFLRSAISWRQPQFPSSFNWHCCECSTRSRAERIFLCFRQSPYPRPQRFETSGPLSFQDERLSYR